MDYVRQFGKANKRIRILLAGKLPSTMTEEQKDRKFLYLLTQLKNKGEIEKRSQKPQNEKLGNKSCIFVNER